MKPMNRSKLIHIHKFIFVLLIVIVAIFLYGYFIPSAQVFGKVYYRGSASNLKVALTFDDGPNEPYTSQILNVLAQYNIKATFFLIGENVEFYPEVARRILAEGHVIGNHSYSHSANHALTGFGSRDAALAEKVIHEVTGVYPRLYRPPHGKTTPWELNYMKRSDMVTVTWNVETSELKSRSPEYIAITF